MCKTISGTLAFFLLVAVALHPGPAAASESAGGDPAPLADGVRPAILAGTWYPAEAEELARTRTRKTVRRTVAPVKKASQNETREVEAELSAALGTRVKVQERDPNSGVILIEYYSAEDLRRILEQLSGRSEMAASGRGTSRRAAFPV